MDIKLETTNNQLVTVSIDGDMDALGCRDIKDVVEHILKLEQNNEVVMDLDKVHFMDSSGIGAIVYLYKRLKEINRAISIHNVSGQPLELMELLRISSAIPVHTKHSSTYRESL